MLERIAAGRTDLVFDWVAQGGAIDASVDGGSLARWCDYYGDVSGLRFLLSQGASLAERGVNLSLSRAAFQGHWRLCEFDLKAGADPNFSDPTTARRRCMRRSASLGAWLRAQCGVAGEGSRPTAGAAASRRVRAAVSWPARPSL